MSARWVAGDCYAVVAGHGAALLDEELGPGVAEALLVLLSTSEGATRALDAIVSARGGRLSALPAFALVQRGPDDDRVLVRGRMRALVGGLELCAEPGSPWVERHVPAGHAVVLECPGARDLGPGTEYLPLLGGVVRACGLGLAAGPLPSSADGVLPPPDSLLESVPAGRSALRSARAADAVVASGGSSGAEDEGTAEVGDGHGPQVAPSAVTADGGEDLREDLPEAPGATISWSVQDEAIASGLTRADGDGGLPSAGPGSGSVPAGGPAGPAGPGGLDGTGAADAAPTARDPRDAPQAGPHDDLTEPLATGAHHSGDPEGRPADGLRARGAATPDDGAERLGPAPAPTGSSPLARVIGTGALGTTTGVTASPHGVPSLLSLVCASGHANPPDALSCSRCPAPLVPPVQVVSQPVLARLAVSTGELVDLLGEVVVGRAPRRPDPAVPARLVAVPSPGHLVSRSHLVISTQGWSVLGTDLGSNNGTVLVRAGTEPVLLGRRLPTPLVMGDLLDLGEGVTVRLVPPA